MPFGYAQPRNMAFPRNRCVCECVRMKEIRSTGIKRALRVLALLVVIAAGVVWLTAGANRGWTRTSQPVRTVDEVTGLEGIEYRKQFVPGLDFLGAALVAGVAVGGASFFFRNQQTSK